MTLEEQQLAVCQKLPDYVVWKSGSALINVSGIWREIDWATQGLQVCHEAEQLILIDGMWNHYLEMLDLNFTKASRGKNYQAISSYKQRLEALCRVWFSERFA